LADIRQHGPNSKWWYLRNARSDACVPSRTGYGGAERKLYVLGGYDLAGTSTATVEVYNPVTNTWTFAHALPFAVNHNAAAVAGGQLYSFGAGAGETFVYNPNNNSWVARASTHYVHSRTAAGGVTIKFTLPAAWVLRASANSRCTIRSQTHGQSGHR
jgi:hypothetical protein